MHGFFLPQPSPDKIWDRMKGYVSWLEVDLDNIGHNLDEIRRHTKAEVMPCVKNNAYGHGLIPVSAYLSGRGVKRVMVAKLREAVQIRDLVGIGVLCMDPLFAKEQFSLVAEKGITQTVYTLETAKALSGAASKLRKTTGVFVMTIRALRL